jgi:hypothetical protein
MQFAHDQHMEMSKRLRERSKAERNPEAAKKQAAMANVFLQLAVTKEEPRGNPHWTWPEPIVHRAMGRFLVSFEPIHFEETILQRNELLSSFLSLPCDDARRKRDEAHECGEHPERHR